MKNYLSLFLAITFLITARPIFAASYVEVFTDDFSDLSYTTAHWGNEFGNWQIINGRYQATEANSSPNMSRSYLLDYPDLTDFIVEYDVHVYTRLSAGNGFGANFRSSYHATGFDGLMFVANKQWPISGESENGSLYWHDEGPAVDRVPFDFYDGQNLHFKFVVEGDLYSCYINDVLQTSHFSTNDDIGYFVLYDNNAGVGIDNFSLSIPVPAVPEPLSIGLLAIAVASLSRRLKK